MFVKSSSENIHFNEENYFINSENHFDRVGKFYIFAFPKEKNLNFSELTKIHISMEN